MATTDSTDSAQRSVDVEADLTRQIANRLEYVANLLRAMRGIAYQIDTDGMPEHVGNAVIGLSERSHQIIDACIHKLTGGPVLETSTPRIGARK